MSYTIKWICSRLVVLLTLSMAFPPAASAGMKTSNFPNQSGCHCCAPSDFSMPFGYYPTQWLPWPAYPPHGPPGVVPALGWIIKTPSEATQGTDAQTSVHSASHETPTEWVLPDMPPSPAPVVPAHGPVAPVGVEPAGRVSAPTEEQSTWHKPSVQPVGYAPVVPSPPATDRSSTGTQGSDTQTSREAKMELGLTAWHKRFAQPQVPEHLDAVAMPQLRQAGSATNYEQPTTWSTRPE